MRLGDDLRFHKDAFALAMEPLKIGDKVNIKLPPALQHYDILMGLRKTPEGVHISG